MALHLGMSCEVILTYRLTYENDTVLIEVIRKSITGYSIRISANCYKPVVIVILYLQNIHHKRPAAEEIKKDQLGYRKYFWENFYRI